MALPFRSVRIRIAVAALLLAAMTALALLGYRNAWIWTSSPLAYWTGPAPIDVLRDIAAAWAFGIAGLLAWHRRPDNRVGPLMVLIGVTLLVGPLRWLPVPALVSLGQWFNSAPNVLLGVLVLAYPTGRVTSGAARAWVGLALTYLAVLELGRTLVTFSGVWECPDCHSLFVLTYDERISINATLVSANVLAVLGVALVVLLAFRWARASPPARRMMAPLWIAGIVFGAVTLSTIVIETSEELNAYIEIGSDVPNVGDLLRLQIPWAVWDILPWAVWVSLLLVPAALLWGLMRMHLGQVRVSALAIELGRTGDRPPLLDSLRRALGDRTLELGLWSRPQRVYVTPEGQPLALPEHADRVVTRLDGDDGPMAAMIHDPALTEQRSLIDGVAAVAQMAIENERLQAEVKAQLEEVRASRERIVSAADEERRRVERNIHDGAQQRLVSLSLALGMAQAKAAAGSPDVAATLADAERELKGAIDELRELARGIHPAILTEAGLGPALESLAEHAPFPVRVETHLDGRLPPLVEATAYFVVAEALTNVAKHAAAAAVSLTASVADGWLSLRVSDDGVGGADADRGSGLRGLGDRVAALGGRLTIADENGGGTRLEVQLPFDEEPGPVPA